MIVAIAFVAAAAFGTLARAEAGRRWNRHDGFAFGTLLVNVSGSFALGALADVAPDLVTIVGVGGLGAYTTFSSFARDTVALIEIGKWWSAVAYVGVTLSLGVAAAAAGIAVAGQ